MAEPRRVLADEDRIPELMCPPPYDMAQSVVHNLTGNSETVLFPRYHEWRQRFSLLEWKKPEGDMEVVLGEGGFHCIHCLTVVNAQGEFVVPFATSPSEPTSEGETEEGSAE